MKQLFTIFIQAILLIVSLSSCDTTIDLDQFKNKSDAFKFDSVPESVDILAGDEYRVVVRAKTNIDDWSISCLSENSNIAEAFEANDSTFVIKGISEGTTNVEVSCFAVSQKIVVNVRDVKLKSFSLGQYQASLRHGDVLLVPVTLDPADYPFNHLNIVADGDEELINNGVDPSQVNADDPDVDKWANIGDQSGRGIIGVSHYTDSVKMQHFLRIDATGIGQAKFSVKGTIEDGSVLEKNFSATVSPIPVDSVFFHCVTDSLFTSRDTLVIRDRTGAVTEIKYYDNYKYYYSNFPRNILRMGVRDTLKFGLTWRPENASVKQAEMFIKYISPDMNLWWKDEGEEKGEDDIDMEDFQKKLNDGEVSDIDDYNKKFGSTGEAEKNWPNYLDISRDENNQADFFAYNVRPKKKSVVILWCRVEYYCNIDKDTRSRWVPLTIDVRSKEHINWKWWE